MRKLTEQFKKEIREATEFRFRMYKNDFCFDFTSEPAVNMESNYIIALLENLNIEEFCNHNKE